MNTLKFEDDLATPFPFSPVISPKNLIESKELMVVQEQTIADVMKQIQADYIAK